MINKLKVVSVETPSHSIDYYLRTQIDLETSQGRDLVSHTVCKLHHSDLLYLLSMVFISK